MAFDNHTVVIVSTNLPDRSAATRLATLLVEHGHAACVNILAECQSIYRWEDKIEAVTEVPLPIKTTRSAYLRIEEMICANHRYQLPEIVSVSADNGLPAYLNWVAAESTGP